MVGLVRINEERTKGLAAYSFDQFKILSFVYGGNLDYYVVADIYPNGTLESDKSLAFILDKSDIELYNTFNVFFNYVKTISLRLKSGSRKICLPPNKYKLECHNAYDIEELYDADNNQIKWPSEAGCGLNKDTVMVC